MHCLPLPIPDPLLPNTSLFLLPLFLSRYNKIPCFCPHIWMWTSRSRFCLSCILNHLSLLNSLSSLYSLLSFPIPLYRLSLRSYQTDIVWMLLLHTLPLYMLHPFRLSLCPFHHNLCQMHSLMLPILYLPQ